jgi:hypothetical protein
LYWLFFGSLPLRVAYTILLLTLLLLLDLVSLCLSSLLLVPVSDVLGIDDLLRHLLILLFNGVVLNLRSIFLEHLILFFLLGF